MGVALDVAIGVTFLYLLLALMVTTIQELSASLFSLRAKQLYQAIASMLVGVQKGTGRPLCDALYNHPLIRNLVDSELKLKKGKPSLFGSGLPSYIPSATFALALVDVLRGERTATAALGARDVLDTASTLAQDLPPGELRQALTLLVSDANAAAANLDERSALVTRRIEAWFNDRMARASGWYKRRSQVISLIFAAIVVVTFNADTIYSVQRLWHDADLRARVVAEAGAFRPAQPGTDNSIGSQATRLVQQADALESAGLPIGWYLPNRAARAPLLQTEWCARPGVSTASAAPAPCWNPQWFDYPIVLLGWVLTVLAVSLGAGFWFDVLTKALQLRGSGPKVSPATGRVEHDSVSK